jgi:retron-type reverse transcriptase
MSPSELFKIEFSAESLKNIFDERIALSNTIGKDGVHPRAFADILDIEINRIIDRVYRGAYTFTHFKQKLILKGAGKPPREISIATVRDRITLRALTNVLMLVFADRKLAAPHYFIEEIEHFVKDLDDSYSFIQIDVKNFYPSIVHSILLTRLRSRIRSSYILDLIINAIGTPTGDHTAGSSNAIGVPQGLSVSNILSSIYMTKFDSEMQAKIQYYRYVDDIVVICKTSHVKRHFSFLSRRLKAIGLECHELSDTSKTRVVPLSRGIDYLGYHITPRSISIRRSSYRKMIENIISVITSVKYTTNHNMVLARLNIKITGCMFESRRFGWMFFFSRTQDVGQLKRLDRYVLAAWRKLGLEQYGLPKRFVRAYYEINFHLDETKYIPKFDEYTFEKKIELIATMDNVETSVIENTWTEDRINKRFWKLVKKEVSELEKDVTREGY